MRDTDGNNRINDKDENAGISLAFSLPFKSGDRTQGNVITVGSSTDPMSRYLAPPSRLPPPPPSSSAPVGEQRGHSRLTYTATDTDTDTRLSPRGGRAEAESSPSDRLRPPSREEFEEALESLRYDIHREMRTVIREQARQFELAQVRRGRE